jgi:NADH-quinone oxidoreductase subunit N
MSVVAKVGGFGALLRVLAIAVPTLVLESAQVTVAPGQTVTYHAAWQDTITIIAALTMILGNVVAIAQRDIKRLLAYSSIAHAGYILMAVAAAGTFTVTADAAGNRVFSLGIAQSAVQASLIYLLAYAFTNVGAFAVAIAVERDDATGTLLDDFSGLATTRPALAIAMTIFMLSLTGVPLTGGFLVKWFVFASTINAGLALLSVIGVLTSLISAYYYLRVIVKMWLEPGEAQARVPFSLSTAVALCTAGVLIIGIILPFATSLVEQATGVALR